jgi:16S rRNA (cytidine1402-2'-O)-methyltransferase
LLTATTELADLGYPLVAAWSRKTFIGQLTGIKDPKKRAAASVATAVYAASRGARVLRVHDVAATKEALAVLEATHAFDRRDDRPRSSAHSHTPPCHSRESGNPSRTAIIALGSNMGDAEATLETAIQRIGLLAEVTLESASSIYLSEPAYNEDQQAFCNAVIKIKTTLEPMELLKALQALEDDFGRVRSESEANGPRTLDLDIVDYEGTVSDEPALLLPHPLALERDFVVTPLVEIAPDYILADGSKPNTDAVTVGHTRAADAVAVGRTHAADAEPSPYCRPAAAATANTGGSPEDPAGKLSICATPIGNLGDITKRVVEALRSADLILAEDTRVARKLLSHLNISANKLERSDENRIRQITPRVIEQIKDGTHVALVSDAGMPGIADPGSVLINAAKQAGCHVEVLPGASAVLTALVASGLGTSRQQETASSSETNLDSTPSQLKTSDTSAFYFGGFLPRKKNQIISTLAQLSELNATLIFFESPHRAEASVKAIAEIFPEREVALARELTKLHEEVLRENATKLVHILSERTQSGQQLKGEIVIVIEPPLRQAKKRIHQDRYEEAAKAAQNRKRGI